MEVDGSGAQNPFPFFCRKQADQLVGALLLGVALAVFGYYTLWVMVLVRVLGGSLADPRSRICAPGPIDQ